MSQSLDLIVAAKNSTDAAFAQLQAGLNGAEAQIKKAAQATDSWSETQQRATMRMERMHEEALKMNTGFVATSDKSELMARNLNALQGAVTTTAGAFGVSAGQLAPLNQAFDVASLGMDKLKTSSVGLNAATIGVAGAGLALGAAIGTWLRTFPAVTKTMDGLVESVYRLATGVDLADKRANAMSGLSEWQKKMAASNEAAVKQQVASMKAAGATEAQIIDMLSGKKKTAAERALEGIKKEGDANKKAATDSKQAWETYMNALRAGMAAYFQDLERTRAAQEGLVGLLGPTAQNATIEMGRLAAATEKLGGVSELSDAQLTRLIASMREQIKLGGENEFGFEALAAAMAEAAARGGDVATAAGIAAENVTRSGNAAEAAAREYARLRQEFEDQLDALDQLGALLGEIGEDVGGMAGMFLRGMSEVIGGFTAGARAALQFADATNSAQKAMAVMNVVTTAWRGGALQGAAAGATFGSSFGPLGTAIGAAAGALVGWIGGASRAREEALRTANQIRQMRDEFISGRGGIEILRLEAEQAGLSLNAMLNARTVEDYQAAVERLQQQLDLFAEGTRLTQEALERWKIPIEATSEAFQNARFHEGMAQFYQDLELLALAGVDFTEVMASEMGPALTEFVQNALNGGRALPEFMRPWIEKMIEAGILLDANGEKITDISQLNFTESLEAGLAKVIQELRELIRLMSGIPSSINTNIHVTQTHENNPGQGGQHYVNPHGEEPPPTAEGGYFPFRPGGEVRRVAEETGEAIIPDDKMAGFLAQAIAMAGAQGGGSGPPNIQVAVYVGGEQFDARIERRIQAGLIKVRR